MSLRWFNIKSKEVRVSENEPQLAAMWGSSDRGPNATVGQDFGWRLAPEVLVEMRDIKNNAVRIQEIAARYGVPTDAVNEIKILEYISDQTPSESAPVANDEDYTDEYNAQVRQAERDRVAALEGDKAQTVTQQTTESLSEMKERAELAERIAKAEREKADAIAAQSTTTTTTEAPELTTTTTKTPTTTTTTTKVK